MSPPPPLVIRETMICIFFCMFPNTLNLQLDFKKHIHAQIVYHLYGYHYQNAFRFPNVRVEVDLNPADDDDLDALYEIPKTRVIEGTHFYETLIISFKVGFTYV